MDRPDRHFKINEKSVPNIYVPEVPPRRPTAVVGPRPHVAHEAPREQVMKKQKPKSESVDDDPMAYAKADAFISQLSKSLPGASSIDKTENFNLNDAEWYWGSITRDDAREKLGDACDGSFLVRDALSGCGEYTLTLKKDGTDRVIKIFHNNGRYGFFKEAGTYSSVVELINRHRTHSLKEYNPLLDVMLLYPVSRFIHDEYYSLHSNKDALVHKFIEVSAEIKVLTSSLESYQEKYNRTENEIGFKRQAHDAFVEAEGMLSEQLEIQGRLRGEAQLHEKQKLIENNELLRQRLTVLIDCKRKVEVDLDQHRRQYQNLEFDINKLKLELNALLRQEKRLRQIAMNQNMSESLMKQILADGIRVWYAQDMFDERNWFCQNVSRSDAERILTGTPVGTFLIRLSSNGSFALSIVADGTVNHCIINKTDHDTFGFAEPYNIYKSLKDLVLHYSINSLEEHNDALQTTLKIPYALLGQAQSSSSSMSPE